MSDLVRVTILDTATGERRSFLEAFEWSGGSEGSEPESDYGCDCDRAFLFGRAGGEPRRGTQKAGRYVVRIEDPDTGDELYADAGWPDRRMSEPALTVSP
jgi:hypothetical protein